jgi:hypothetical protein
MPMLQAMVDGVAAAALEQAPSEQALSSKETIRDEMKRGLARM